MEEYTLYTTKNIFQIRKNQLDAKLDRDLQNIAKNYFIEIKIFNSKETNPNNRKKNIEEEDKKNINLPIIDIYLYAIAIMHICWREQNIINCLESLVLFHLHQFLHILDKTTIITIYDICYDLNSLDSGFRNISKLGVNNKIFITITNI